MGALRNRLDAFWIWAFGQRAPALAMITRFRVLGFRDLGFRGLGFRV